MLVELSSAPGTDHTVHHSSTPFYDPLIWESLRERDWVARWVVFATLEGATLEGAAPDASLEPCGTRGCRIVHLVGVRLPNLENHQRRYMNE